MATDKAAKAEQAYALAFDYESKHGCCTQCVIAAIQEVFGVVDDQTFKASYLLAAGGGLTTRGTLRGGGIL